MEATQNFSEDLKELMSETFVVYKGRIITDEGCGRYSVAGIIYESLNAAVNAVTYVSNLLEQSIERGKNL